MLSGIGYSLIINESRMSRGSMANIIVDEEWLRKTLSTLQTSFIILDHLEDNGVDLWDGYVSAMVSASYELENQLERRVNDNIETITALQSPASLYVVLRHSKWNAPLVSDYYRYAGSYVEAQEYVDKESALARQQGHSYYWKIVSAESV